MLDGPGLGPPREMRGLPDDSVPGPAAPQSAHRSPDAAAFARLLVKAAVARTPPPAAAATAGGELPGLGRSSEDGPSAAGTASTGLAYVALALTSGARPAAAADAAYSRTRKATSGAKGASPDAAPAGLGEGQSEDSGSSDAKAVPASSVQRLAQEVFAQASVFARSDGAECVLRIASPDLGVVRVLVAQTADGVNIRFVADQDATRQALDGQLGQLRSALANAGVRLGVMEVLGAGDGAAEHSDGRDGGLFAPERRAARLRRGRSPLRSNRLDVIV